MDTESHATTSVLLVGWRSASARALARYGCHVTCLVGPADAGKAQASGLIARCVTVPAPKDIEDCLSGLARAGLTPADFDRICSGSEFTITCASVLGGPGKSTISPATAVALRDKFVQKHHVREGRIPVAACYTVDELAQLQLRKDMPHDGVVVKPLSGAGAMNTFHLRNQVDLTETLAAFGTDQSYGPWLVEDYVPGHEHQVDGVVRGGTITALVVSRYLQNPIEIHFGGLLSTIALAPAEHSKLYNRARLLAAEALTAIGHSDGVFHLEAFDQQDRLVFGECAGRVSGGMTDQVIKHMFGLDLHDAWARAALGLPASPEPVLQRDAVYGELYLPCPPGELIAAPTSSEILERAGVVTVRLDVAVGQHMPDMTTASNIRAGTALVTGSSETEVEERVLRLAAWFRSSCKVR